MQSSFVAALAFTLQSEGGWSDNPDDPGGPTMKGITLATYRHHVPDATKDDLRDITNDEVADIYRTGYWNAVKGDDLPAGIDLSVFDFGVNAGPSRSIRMLQKAVGVNAYGVIGPISLAAIRDARPDALIAALGHEQRMYYQSLPTFDTFGDGWMRRTAERKAAALRLMEGAAS